MQNKKAYIIVDLGYGDAGKGSMVDYLSRNAENTLVVRYNGGAQAAHNAVTPEGIHHTFSQFGSGSMYKNTATHLSRFMLVNPITLMNEADALASKILGSPYDRLTVEENALVITPFHQAANKLKETARGDSIHGSCGQGIGETMSDYLKIANPLTIKDLGNARVTKKKLLDIQSRKLIELSETIKSFRSESSLSYEIDVLTNERAIQACLDEYKKFCSLVRIVDANFLRSKLSSLSNIVFEGSQGVLLDQDYGFYPYTTWSDITTKNAHTLLENFDGVVETIGLTRAYQVRHGAGPFVTEDEKLSIREPFNITNPWQRNFRIGHLDLVTLKYALEVVGGVNSIALTHLDQFWKKDLKICPYYYYTGNIHNVQDFFGYNSMGYLNKIKVVKPVSLKHQEQLGNMLKECKPQLNQFDAPALFDLESNLNTPISYVSWGPTSRGKFVRKYTENRFELYDM